MQESEFIGSFPVNRGTNYDVVQIPNTKSEKYQAQYQLYFASGFQIVRNYTNSN